MEIPDPSPFLPTTTEIFLQPKRPHPNIQVITNLELVVHSDKKVVAQKITVDIDVSDT